MIGDPGWLYVPNLYEPDYDDEIIELQSYQEMMCDVESYDDYFVE